MDVPDSAKTAFWTSRWEADKIPWDLGGTPPSLISFLQKQTGPARVLIPGCGSAYEVRTFHQAGHDVTAIDFSAPAVEHAKEQLGPLGDKVVQGNFFKHDWGERRYDLIYERGFLCSLPPLRWKEYAARMAELLAPGGKLVGLFLYGKEPEPPPFPLSPEVAQMLFGHTFRLLGDAVVHDPSVPVYAGMEHWQEWERVGV